MTYREASLSFEGIHLAALTGENGAGKSSLLDAMTWAVWGQARAKRDDELIRLGQSEMEVEFTFILNDNTYRLVRKRDASKRGRSDLSLQVADSGGWRTLTESSVRATEKKIGQLMRLNYNTFINSAFLLQGRADEFTTQTPAERKRILSDILGLEIYDKYADQAKQIANEKEKEANLIEADIRRIEQELAKEPAYRTELAAAQTEGATLNAALQAAELEMVALRDQHRAVNDKQRPLEDLRDRLTGAAADLADMAEAMQAAQAAIERYQAILARQAEIEAGEQQLAQARTAVQDWEQRLQESAKLSERRHQLERAIQTAQANIEADLRATTTKIEMLSPKIAAADSLREQLAAAEMALTELRQWETTQAASREALAALGEESARLNEQNKQLKLEMDEIKENLTQLEQAGSNCPVCKRPLDETHRTEVLGQFSTEGRVKGDLWRANRERLQEIGTEQKNAQRELQAGEKQLQRLPQAQGRVAQLEQSLREAEAAAVELTGVQAEQLALQQRLDNRDFAAEVLANLAGVEAELAALGYDKAAHAEARRQAQELSRFEEAGRQLAEAQKRLSEEEKRLAREQAGTIGWKNRPPPTGPGLPGWKWKPPVLPS
jgi:exonuclease SbcC